ncbi:peptidylprolyl isomerase [Peribacillus saganii]|uniref:peptidylprolyl isomerase n=1 Tax=Peribacillus saganii TaxID=2303992 RepID=A0A372LL47_9BACI|nr:peptidyl-prolyl cis-trans isomerase [Peribacillus saganii]RFU66902.1 peptidylprolyl isomerase [Peribacillus saganii]
MLSRKRLWLIIAGLIFLNIGTLIFFVGKWQTAASFGSDEPAAVVDREEISREKWMAELEDRYGKEVLEEMINEEVVFQAAKKYKISVSDEEVDRAAKIMKITYAAQELRKTENEEQLRRQAESSLLFEELLTKDVTIPEKQLKKYYEENPSHFEIPTSFRLSQIVVKKREQALQISEELENGSTFAVLAMEKSTDEFTASQGGHLGYISRGSDRLPDKYLAEAEALKPKEWSKPFKTDEGWVIIKLHERIKGQSYGFKQVKDQIRRQIALEQMKDRVSVNVFWDEMKVEWFYDGDNSI